METLGKYQALQYVYDVDSAQRYLNACVREAKSSFGDERQALKLEQSNILEFAKHYSPSKISFFKQFFESL